MKRTSWSAGLVVTGDGVGVVGHAGAAAVRLLADRVGLTDGLSVAMARRGFVPVHDRGRVLVDVATMLVDGGEAIILAAFLVAAVNAGLLLSRYGYDVAEPPNDDRERIEPLPSPRSALHRRRAFARRRGRSKDPATAPPGQRPAKPITSPTQWKRATETTVTD